MYAYMHAQTQIQILSCPVFPLSGMIMSRVAFQERKVYKQLEQVNTLLGNIWFTGSGHGAAHSFGAIIYFLKLINYLLLITE